MGVKITWGALLGLWLVLVLIGKSGFVHILLLVGISVLLVEMISKYRAGAFRKQNGPAD
jgi:phosphatidylserine synthase